MNILLLDHSNNFNLINFECQQYLFDIQSCNYISVIENTYDDLMILFSLTLWFKDTKLIRCIIWRKGIICDIKLIYFINDHIIINTDIIRYMHILSYLMVNCYLDPLLFISWLQTCFKSSWYIFSFKWGLSNKTILEVSSKMMFCVVWSDRFSLFVIGNPQTGNFANCAL